MGGKDRAFLQKFQLTNVKGMTEFENHHLANTTGVTVTAKNGGRMLKLVSKRMMRNGIFA